LPRRLASFAIEGDREGDHRVGQGHQQGGADRPPDDRLVDRFVDQRFEVFEGEFLDGQPAQRVDRPEGGDQQQGERAQVADHQPAHRAGEERPYLQAPTALEEAGEPMAHRPPLQSRFRCHESELQGYS